MKELSQQIANLSPEQRALFEKRLQQKGLKRPQLQTIPKRQESDGLPLSFAQQRLWFIQQLDPDNNSYNVPSALRLKGQLKVAILEQTLNEIVKRHENLRTTFATTADKQPVQCVSPFQPFSLPVVDLREVPNPESEVQRLATEEFQRPFELTKPLLRLRLLKLGETDCVLFMTAHHIISDRWSIGIFLREITLLYQAFSKDLVSPLAELPIQYADWAIWQRQRLQGETLERQITYWKQQLEDAPILELPTDRSRPAIPTYRGAQYPLELAKPLSDALKAFSAKEGVTLFALLLAVFNLLLHRYTNQDDIVVGTEIANRDRTETEGLIGLLVNTLVLRSDLSGNPTFRELLSRVREVTLGAYAHQDLPFEKLVEVLNPERNLSQMMPLFQVKFDLQQAPVKNLELAGLTLERLPFDNGTVKYELRLNLQDSEQGLRGQVEYSTDLFDETTIARMAEHWQILLERIVANPELPLSELSLLSEAEQQKLLLEWNDTQRNYPTASCIHQLFEEQVEKTPDVVAVVFEERKLTYQQLNQKANQLARYLQKLGVKPEVKVGVCVERSLEMVIALLGILKAGGAYVPLDPAYPQERLNFILEDSQVSVLLSEGRRQEAGGRSQEVCLNTEWQIIAQESQENPRNSITPENSAYVIYTSGSTGRPKGIAIEHRSTVQLLHWARDVFSPEVIAGVLASTSICFDLSVFELFVPLSWGGKAILAENALALPTLAAANEVTLINTVPSAIAQLLQTNGIPPSVRTVNLAGEALQNRLVQQLEQREHIQQIFNLYGPSEDTTYSTYALVKSSSQGSVPIGQPIANTQVYILDRYLQPVPIGIPGELYVGGAGLARGYLNRPELTAERFLPNPFRRREQGTGNGEQANNLQPSTFNLQLYKTGDLVRYRTDRNLEFLGRLDHQVKIRGYRIEIGEIEAVLSQYPAICETVVTVREDEPGSKRLVAYIAISPTPPAEQTAQLSLAPPLSRGATAVLGFQSHLYNGGNPRNTVTPQVKHVAWAGGGLKGESNIQNPLRRFLEEKLPSYMIPTTFVELEALPRLPNGKVDRKSLPAPNTLRPELETAYVAAQTELEKVIASIWQKELNVEKVGIHDNFFELGGHSLLGIKIIAEISEVLGVQIPLRILFQKPTVAGLIEQIEAVDNEKQQLALPKIIPNPEERYQPFPLTDIQQAYLIGRSEAFELGNVATHGYREIETVGLEVKRVEQALRRLIERHDMLRVIVQADGQQQILPTVPPYEIKTVDLRGKNPQQVEARFAEIRDRLSHQILPTDQWPLFEIQAALLDCGKVRFHISFDVLMGDAWSFQLLGWELAQIVQNPDKSLPSLTLSFRDYVLAEIAFRESELYRHSLEYWHNRLPKLPPSPELPLEKNLAAIKNPHFVRRTHRLEPESWQRLKQKATQTGITPSGLLLAAFAEILTTWSKSPNFTLNLTLFNRLPLYPEVDRIIGDFTSSTLLAVDNSGQDSFSVRARRIQAQLWNDLDYRHVSGVRVLRELARLQGRTLRALMPVVFTSTLTQSSQNQPSSSRAWQTEVVYSVSQTSQVYLDHQVSEIAGALVFNWDAIEALFPAGVLEDMFSAYVNFLERLANEEELWQAQRRQLLPAAQVEQIAAINHTETDLGSKNALLHGLFFEQVPLNSQKAAIIASSRTLTYQELSDRALTLAHQLQALGVRPHQLVAIVMEKGWEQVVAALGILASGAAYVPIDPELPIERRLHLLQETEAQQIITQSWLDTSLAWPENITRICVDTLESSNNLPLSEFKIQDRSFTSLAYVIYTSGSTGLPKGVAIAHQGAVNTILDINQRFHVTSQDCVLALSSLSFDLSVYDIFGTLAAGGTIVIPDAEATKDPAHWAALLIQHGVTIWNSVPALMQMLVEYLTENSIQSSLRLVMLSGDWLPLNLSDRIRTVFGDTQVVSLGGATEASIWSILYPITTVDPTWKSIPYGRPMANQHFYVLNEALEPCPIWVTGQLYIGGIGLAKGYWRNEEKTNASFIIHPQTKERLYKTGDLGRYLSDGNIEFLGREDFQVKVNGYRIELGEIETILKQHPAIAQAVVSATRQSRENKQLVAYIVPHREVAANLPSSPDQKIAEAYDPHQLNGQPEKAPAAALSKLKDVLSDPVERIEFKLKQLGLRQPESSQSSIQLPQPEFDEKLTQVYLRRQSYRQFLEKAISLEQFSKFISCLVQMKLEGSPLPKYRYASAGSLYPVQTYLYVKPNRVEGLETGIYYYHPAEHRLVLLSANFEIDGSVYGVNQPIFEQSAFSLFLIGQLHAIIPLYGEKARDFCLLEAGYISQLLMETAPEQEIGLCPVGALEFDLLRDSFVLEPSQILLHSLVGGRIDLAWTKQWLQSTTVQKPEAIADKLRQFLCQKLPEYMMPSSYMLLETLPLTSNGKVDRKALPKPDSLCLSAQTKYVAPRSELEKAIASIWQKALKLEKVGIHDNFFDLGGNSLSATQAIAQMRQTLQVELSIRRFFEAPTIADLALAVEQENRGERERPHLDKIERIERGDSQQLLANLDRISEQEMDALLAEMLNEREES